MQLAQMIQQVAQQMQGQATAAKYGAKLNYLQSLKCGGKAKAKKKEQGGKVCPDCEKQGSKSLVSKHQYGGNFYRGWSADDIRTLQNKLAGHGYYQGELDGIVGRQTIEAVKAYQRAHGLKEDGMWGVNTNSQQKMIDNAIVNKGVYSKGYTSEKGSLKTHKGMEYQGKTLKDLSNQQINDVIAYYISNPEAMYSDDKQHSDWRMLLHNSGQQGADVLNQILASMTPEERAKVDSKKRTHQYNVDQVTDQTRETTNKVARQLVPILAAPLAMGGAATALLGGAGVAGIGGLVGGLGGSVIGGAVGKASGTAIGRKKAEETNEHGYVHNISDPVAERYGAVGVINDPKTLIAREAAKGEGYGRLIGGAMGSLAGSATGAMGNAAYANHMGRGYAVRGYKDPVAINDTVSPYGTTTVSPKENGWQVFKAGFQRPEVMPGRQRLGGPHGLKYTHSNGKVYNPGSYASNEVVSGATSRFGNTNAPYDVTFGGNTNLGTSAKLGEAYTTNMPAIANMTGMVAPTAMVSSDIDTQMEGPSRRQERRERRQERREERKAKKNYFGGWL